MEDLFAMNLKRELPFYYINNFLFIISSILFLKCDLKIDHMGLDQLNENEFMFLDMLLDQMKEAVILVECLDFFKSIKVITLNQT
jgi:hypothetical protein